MTTTDAIHSSNAETQPPSGGLRASDVMTGEVVTVLATTTVGEAMTLMRTLGVRHLPVLGDGRFVGLVDDRLVALALLAAGGFGDVLEHPVSTAMTHYVPQVAPGEPLQRVAHLLRTSRCDAIVVIDAQDHLLGIITMVDVVTAVALGDAGRLPLPSRASWPPPVAYETAVIPSTPVPATSAR
jgi:CBS domain-containing protein